VGTAHLVTQRTHLRPPLAFLPHPTLVIALSLPALPQLLLAVDTATVAGIALWAIALYWGFSPLAERAIAPLESLWGEGSLRASLLGMVPFLAVGALTYWGLALSLGDNWAVSLGVISAVGCGVYELGRRAGQASGE
jgi:hypothetical protein